jgi:uncharacterized protein YehS (DUF1456 family)
MVDIIEKTGIIVSKSELGAILRKGGDKYVRNFLKGLAVKYRE